MFRAGRKGLTAAFTLSHLGVVEESEAQPLKGTAHLKMHLSPVVLSINPDKSGVSC